MGWKVMCYKVRMKGEGDLSQGSFRGPGEEGKDVRYLGHLITSPIF